jgi:hypothetical protein
MWWESLQNKYYYLLFVMICLSFLMLYNNVQPVLHLILLLVIGTGGFWLLQNVSCSVKEGSLVF